MTYSWEEVREEACELYKTGKTLEYIRNKLSRDDFNPGTRIWRKRLDEWGVKRRRIAQKRPRVSQDSDVCGPTSKFARHGELEKTSTKSENNLTYVFEHKAAETPPSTAFDRRGPVRETSHVNEAAPQSSPPLSVAHESESIGQSSARLILGRTSPERSAESVPGPIDGNHLFDHGFQPFLNRSIPDIGPNSGSGEVIRNLILQDEPDKLREFLESNMETLSKQVFEFWIILAVLSRASLTCCTVLIDFSVNYLKFHRIQVGIIVLRLLEARENQAREILCYSILDHYSDWAHLDPSKPRELWVYERFLLCSKVHHSDPTVLVLILQCLQRFLRLGFSPFSRCCIVDLHCRHKDPCDSPAKIALRHCKTLTSLEMILRSFDIDEYGEEFFNILLDAYLDPNASIGDTNLIACMKVMSARYRHLCGLVSCVKIFNVLLARFPPDRSAMMLKLARLLLPLDKADLLPFPTEDYWPEISRMLHLLTTISSPVRLHLAELVLDRYHRLMPGLFPYSDRGVHMKYASMTYVERLWKHTSNAYVLQECVVHSVSKTMICESNKIEIVREALRLRKAVGLGIEMDYVAVRGDVMLELLKSANLDDFDRKIYETHLEKSQDPSEYPWVRFPELGKLDKVNRKQEIDPSSDEE